MSLYEAKELMDDYPEETKGFTVHEVERIWQEHSEMYAASWLNPSKDEVESVFSFFR